MFSEAMRRAALVFFRIPLWLVNAAMAVSPFWVCGSCLSVFRASLLLVTLPSDPTVLSSEFTPAVEVFVPRGSAGEIPLPLESPCCRVSPCVFCWLFAVGLLTPPYNLRVVQGARLGSQLDYGPTYSSASPLGGLALFLRVLQPLGTARPSLNRLPFCGWGTRWLSCPSAFSRVSILGQSSSGLGGDPSSRQTRLSFRFHLWFQGPCQVSRMGWSQFVCDWAIISLGVDWCGFSLVW